MHYPETMSSVEVAGYRLVEPIGRGAAGTVYAAEFGKLRRPVAIKILHRHLGDESGQRMLAEARTLSMLDHPGIVKVFDVGTTRDGRVFVVMEQLFGEPLHDRLQREQLAEDRVRLFGSQLASALEVAHAAGIVHRDLKPENVFVVADPDVPCGERVKLIDFGIAKHVEPLTGVERTATGIVLGTPAYMAPERFRDSRNIDPRADVYSFGVVLYLMATGTRPFLGHDTDELAAEHAYCSPRPPTLTGVSRGLSDVIERCLAKLPEDRYASMADAGAALRDIDGPNAFDDDTTFVWGTRVLRTLPPMPPPIPPRRLARASTHGRQPPLEQLAGATPMPPAVALAVGTANLGMVKRMSPRRSARPRRSMRAALVLAIAIGLALAIVIDLRTDIAKPAATTSEVVRKNPLQPSAAPTEPTTVQPRSSKPKRPKKPAKKPRTR